MKSIFLELNFFRFKEQIKKILQNLSSYASSSTDPIKNSGN
jgi:hypothetical protein